MVGEREERKRGRWKSAGTAGSGGEREEKEKKSTEPRAAAKREG